MNAVAKANLVFAFFLAALSKSSAQVETTKYELGINGGTLIYQGDLVPNSAGNYKTLKPALGVYVSRSLSRYFSARVNFAVGKISSDESAFATPPFRRKRNFVFSTPVTELSTLLVFNPFGQYEEGGRKLTPYVFAGAGLSFVHIKRDWSRVDTAVYNHASIVQTGLAIDTLQRPPRKMFVLPVGAGLRYNISPAVALNAEAIFRFTGSDYLDGFKYAANPNNKDNYYGLSVGLSFKLGNGGLGFGGGGYKCPAVN